MVDINLNSIVVHTVQKFIGRESRELVLPLLSKSVTFKLFSALKIFIFPNTTLHWRSMFILQPGFHSGKTTCAQFTEIKDKLLLITAGDDTQVIVSEVNQQSGEIIPRATMTSHISSVKCCCASHCGPAERLLVTGGGRAQLNICYIKQGKL